jgi:aldose 1-epimerase
LGVIAKAPILITTETLELPSGFGIEVVDRGAALQTLNIPTASGPLNCVLGYTDASSYLTDTYYVGAIVGRFANRIRGGRISVAGLDIQLDANEEPTGNCLHGGSRGFDRKRWTLLRSDDEQSITCKLISPDGDQGFPGNLTVQVEYRMLRDFVLSVEVIAETDAPTVINLAHHPYFNLDREKSAINDHQLRIFAGTYTPLDDVQIPSGEIRDVDGTMFDFRDYRRIGDARLDQNFVLKSDGGDLVLAAELYCSKSNVRLGIRTTQPGLQVYTADVLNGSFSAREGIALEAQNFPDAPNHPAFPSALLLPGEQYRHQTVYEFAVS